MLAGIDQELDRISACQAEPWRIRGIQLSETDRRQCDMLIMPRTDKPGLLLAIMLIDIQSSVEQILRQQRNELTLSLDRLAEQTSSLRTANDRLTSLDRERRALLNLIARDINSSVSVIAGYVDWLSDRLDFSAGSGEGVALSTIRASALRMSDLVKDVLVLEDIEQKLTAIDWQKCDLLTLTRTVVAMWHSVAAMQDVQIDVHVEDNVPGVEADIELLRQALQVLLETSLHLASPGSRVLVHISTWDRWAILRFELLFPKASQAQRQAQGGEQMDLQLALVRLIAEGHGGHLSFEDYERKGSALSLWLLLQSDGEQKKRDVAAAPPTSDVRIAEQGSIQIHTTSQQIWVDAEEVSLTTSEYRLLLYLAEHTDQVVSHEQIALALWPETDSESLDSLRVLVWRLRQKLGKPKDGEEYIRTVRGFGYMLAS